MRVWDDRYVLVTRGDTISFGIEIEGLEQDLDTAFFTCRKNYTDPPIFQKSLEGGITKQETGKYVVRVAPEDTKDIEPGQYHYDLEIGANGDVYTILKGILEFEQDVTY